ncbi:hypothetical protein HKX69_05975 [Streptomyces argyrophyllae]|uniref:Uncharacterized protein n=1 Tax=Streptomyces argyrophylli TaxID=2726118 RepID=A0A6M4PDQ8_9ACTN|nr:hypothetical protein [Streptomyces argyrophyllae]QJS09121.1 hypothetical protein HKX69_05975 [Streptomyces argyrophyllae]
MRPYSILNALPPEAFLKPEDFATDFDGRTPGYAEEQYLKGLEISREYDRVVIRSNTTWAAECGPYVPEANVYMGNAAYSYEGIGYHAETAALLRGFLDGPAPIDVERRQDDYSVTTTRIKEASK